MKYNRSGVLIQRQVADFQDPNQVEYKILKIMRKL